MAENFESLIRYGDISKEAQCWRLRIARTSLEPPVSQTEMARLLGISKSTYGAYEMCDAEPATSVLKHFHRRYGIDFNFMIFGEVRNLPTDLQSRLYAAAAKLASKPGHRTS